MRVHRLISQTLIQFTSILRKSAAVDRRVHLILVRLPVSWQINRSPTSPNLEHTYNFSHSYQDTQNTSIIINCLRQEWFTKHVRSSQTLSSTGTNDCADPPVSNHLKDWLLEHGLIKACHADCTSSNSRILRKLCETSTLSFAAWGITSIHIYSTRILVGLLYQ